MYCRKCGAQIKNNAVYCDTCGEKVVVLKQRSYAQRYADNKAKAGPDKTNRELKNPYILPALATSLIAFILAIFPWPRAWGIGTSLWMRILIVGLALLADYHCTKSRQINNLYQKKYQEVVQPNTVKLATGLAVITTIVSMFALFYK